MQQLSQYHKDIIGNKSFENKISIYVCEWEKSCCTENPTSLFVFTDNDTGLGYIEQAIIRDYPNSIGIPTKKNHNDESDSYYTDQEYESNCEKIFQSIISIIEQSVNYDEIAFPHDGFGMGNSKLHIHAPNTLKYMNNLIHEYFGIDYDHIQKNGLEIYMDPKYLNLNNEKEIQV